MATVYIGVVGTSPKAADIWIEKFVQGAIDKGIEYKGPVSLPTRTVNGKTYHGRQMQMEPAGRSIDFLDYELPDYVDVQIGIDSGEITTADLYQQSSIENEDDTDVEQVTEKEGQKTIDEKTANSATENSNIPEETGDETDSPSLDTHEKDSSGNDPTLEKLRNQAKDAAVEEISEDASVDSSGVTEYSRSSAIRDYVKARAGGSCEGCDESAPFVSKTGDPYFHAHHIHELSDGGSDMPSTVIALCPNCHYRVHHGEDGNDYNELLREKVLKIESQ